MQVCVQRPLSHEVCDNIILGKIFRKNPKVSAQFGQGQPAHDTPMDQASLKTVLIRLGSGRPQYNEGPWLFHSSILYFKVITF